MLQYDGYQYKDIPGHIYVYYMDAKHIRPY